MLLTHHHFHQVILDWIQKKNQPIPLENFNYNDIKFVDFMN